MNIKNFLMQAALITVLAGPITASRSTAHGMGADDQVIRISASGFQFQPSAIRVKRGIPVTLELISEDRHHGFKLPDFHIRADVKVGAVEKIRFIPDKAGKFTFICDVFCGDGHEDMSGTLIVVEE